MSRDDLVDIDVTIVHETEKAILVDHGGDAKAWLPKSQIEVTDHGNGRTTVTLPEWLAQDKYMI